MSEQELIQKSYEQSIQELYKTFYDTFTFALGDLGQEQQAQNRFRVGIEHAKHVRDLALSLLED